LNQFTIENTQQFEIFSKEINQEFFINIGLPPNYSEDHDKYPVVYVTDAGPNFSGLMGSIPLMQLVNDLPSFVLVGISYKSQNSMDSMSLRNRDLTPTNDKVWMATQKDMYKIFGEDLPQVEAGGAKYFLDFINDEIKPFINNKYYVDTTDQTYCGFSLGGLFGLYTLFNSSNSFKRYVIGSPSIWWDDRYILKVEEEYAKKNKNLSAKVFMSIGDLEEEEGDNFKMISNMKTLSKTLLSRKYEGLDLKTAIFEDETHCSAVSATLNRGLRNVFK
jgi:hypothetical protein